MFKLAQLNVECDQLSVQALREAGGEWGEGGGELGFRDKGSFRK